MVDPVFFYGTLMTPFSRTRGLSAARDIVFLSGGSITGALYKVGIYPALVADPSGRVVGEVHQMSHPGRMLQALDEYEGCRLESPESSLYFREVVPVTLDSGDVIQAWTYFYNAPLGHAHRIESGDYLDHTIGTPAAGSVAPTQAGRRSSAF